MPPSGRFQSRLLSYLSQQRLRLGDRTSRWFRHAANAVALGAQVVLYPVYVAFQSARLVGRQMGPAAQRLGLFLENVKRHVQGKPALPASPPADAPIHKTLRAIRSAGFANLLTAAPDMSALRRDIALRSAADLIPLDSKDERMSLSIREASALSASEAAELRSPSAPAPAGNLSAEIGGIASRLDTRLLVLVTTTNALIDLSPQQQRWLQQQIIWELADDGRARRRWLRRSGRPLAGRRAIGELGRSATEAAIAELAPQPPRSLAPLATGRLARMLPVPMPRETAALPVKAFYQLMAWVQTGPVAIAANLFQEAALAVYFPTGEPHTPAAPPAAPANGSPAAPALAGTAPLIPPNLRPRSPGEILLHLVAEPEGDLPPAPVPAEQVAPVGAIALTPSPDLMPDAHSVILTISRHTPTSPTPTTHLPTSPPTHLSHPPNTPKPYIDTPATLVRYEKHPLEAILDWIDRGMVWLEMRLTRLWQWLRGEE
jgi:hypothetical protein